MASPLLRLYHQFPPPLRNAAASLHGYYLRWWRYGPETERLIEEALARDAWSRTRLRRWQEARTARLLHRAATQVPYYRRQWQERRRHGDRASWEVLENWPVLSKEEVRSHPKALVADDCHPRWMRRRNSSGTTGTPQRTYAPRAMLRQLYAVYEARIRRWNGVSRHERWAIMGGQLVAPYEQQEPPFWVYNAALNQLYLSTHHLAPRHAAAYAGALRRYRPTHLVMYPSSASVLAKHVIDQSLQVPSLRVAVSNGEALRTRQRRLIEEAFGCPVRSTYGMNEAVAAASECAHGTMHLWPECGRLEVIDDDRDAPVEAGEAGRLVATGLMNEAMPLVRYAVGDRGRLGPSGEGDGTASTCACGRELPVLASIEGRVRDLVTTRDGRKVFSLGVGVFKGLPIEESQIVQESREQLRVRIVPAASFGAEHGEVLRRRIREHVGDLEISVETLERIPRTAGGKVRAVVSNVA